MRHLSGGVDELLHDLKASTLHEAVVIGSGYGGAVAALRLAERGVAVVVLERGQEYLSGEFPGGLGQLVKMVRFDRTGTGKTVGLDSALFDIRVGKNISTLVGNALGGTSQINANVMAMPDSQAFERLDDHGKRLWPEDITSEALAPYFTLAATWLEGELFSNTFSGVEAGPPGSPASTFQPRWVTPKKTEALQALAKRIKDGGFDVTYERAQLTIRQGDTHTELASGTRGPQLDPGICVGCGECVAGCNFNAKKTLTHTYLPRAKDRGARLFTGVTVVRLEKHDDATWSVHFQATHDRPHARVGVAAPVYKMRARQVIVAAGTLGSTEILMRSAAPADGQAVTLKLSSTLGRSLSTNGDNLAAVYRTPEAVNGVGIGDAEYARDGAGVGPTITGSIRVRPSAELGEPLLIQDAAIPRTLAGAAHELVTTLGTMAQLPLRPTDAGNRSRGSPIQDWASLNPGALRHTQLLLIMGHDRAGGSMHLNSLTDRLEIRYQTEDAERQRKLHAKVLACAEDGGGLLLENPLLHPVPERLTRVLSGSMPGGSTFTVHPLGGCRMADDVNAGVVDSCGRVFDAAWDGSADTSRHHVGLMILDGSIVPASIGVNPLLTITALAERAMAHALTSADNSEAKSEGPPAPVPTPPALNPKTYAPEQRDISVRFTESLRSQDFVWQVSAGQMPTPASAHLLLHLPLPSLESFASDASHTVQIPPPGMVVAGLSRAPDDQAGLRIDVRLTDVPGSSTEIRTASQPSLATLEVIGGTVRLLPATLKRDPWLRVFLTWAKLRLFRDGFSGFKCLDKDGWRSFANMLQHARERREMVYEVRLRANIRGPGSAEHYVLVGRKSLGYAASTAQLLSGFWPTRRLERPGAWADLGTMHVTVYDMMDGVVGSGTFTLDMIDMTRFHAPQLGGSGNTPDALVKLAGYPLWMLRILLKTRFWDFRLPDYPRFVPRELNASSTNPSERICGRIPVPTSDNLNPPTYWPHHFPDLVVRDGKSLELRRVSAVYVSLSVLLAAGSTEHIELRLIRYPQNKAHSTSGRTTQTTQFRTLLMLNGFAQSTLPLVAQELRRHDNEPARDDVNLATFFYERGFDIWLFEYRTSSVLEASKLPCTLDDIAMLDVPAAVEHILGTLQSAELPRPQIYAYGHCVGAAALVMSMLGGYLQHEATAEDGADPPPSKLAGIIFSQMQAYTVGSVSAQARFAFGGLARDALGINYFRLSAAERGADATESMLDRFFATLPVDPGEQCPPTACGEEEHGDGCTCKRMSGIISRLFKHDRILKETHRRLPAYFGRANTSLMVHASRCMEAERLVDADGQNIYVTDSNITRYLNLPVALLHGKHNAVLNVESTLRTHEALVRLNPHLESAGVCMKIIAEDFAHFDTTVGHGPKMREQILAPFDEFLKRAWHYNASSPAQRTHPGAPLALQAPLSGPVIGWVRQGRVGNTRGYLVRVWIEVDESGDSNATRALVQLENDPARLVHIRRVPIDSDITDTQRLSHWRHSPKAGIGYIAVAVADIFVDARRLTSERPLEVFMASVHNLITRGTVVLPGVPSGYLAPAVVDSLRNALRTKEQERDLLAQSADPGTISRVRRTGSRMRKESGVARLYHSALIGNEGTPASFVCASCRYSGTPFERQREDQTLHAIADRIARTEINPRFMLMLGDQIYADASAGVMDSPSPVERVVARSRLAFGSAGFRRIVTMLPTYMVMDDHEIEESWSKDKLRARTGGRLPQADRLRNIGFATFAAFQWLHSPRLSMPRGRRRKGRFSPGRFGYAFELDDCAFFVLDTRSHRDRYPAPQRSDPVMCTPAQLAELEHWLNNHPAAVKFVVTGSVIVPGLRHHVSQASDISVRAQDNWQLAHRQRCQVLTMIAKCTTRNIILLSGDYHCAAVSSVSFGEDPNKRVYAVVSPPIYAPIPSVNIHPLDLSADPVKGSKPEIIALGAGLQADVRTRAWPGDGYMEISVSQQGGQRWLRVTSRLSQLDRPGTLEPRHEELQLPLA